MKKTLFWILIGLPAFIITIQLDNRAANAGFQPDIKVSVAILAPDQSTTAAVFGFEDPIYTRISLQVGSESIFTTARFRERNFHLNLLFTMTRPDGSQELITAVVPAVVDLKPPRTISGTGIQVEAVDELPAGWAWTVGPFDAKDWYLLKAGMFSVVARVSMISYPASVIEESEGLTYAPIGSAEWSGQISSVPVNFTISGEFCADNQKPQILTLEYTGKDCGASSNSQDQDTCQGDPAGASPVLIRATTKQDPFHPKAKVWFEGEVSLHDNPEFDLDATSCQGQACRNETRLGGETFVSIFDKNGVLLQNVAIHTSCSEPLNFGDQFGSLRLIGFTPEP
jgi:hypothetical protein